MFVQVICLKDTDTVSVLLFPALNNVCQSHLFKNVLYIQSQNRIVKTRKIKAKSIENKEIIMAMKITKAIITQIFVIIMMRMRIKIENRNHIKI